MSELYGQSQVGRLVGLFMRHTRLYCTSYPAFYETFYRQRTSTIFSKSFDL